MVMYSNRRKVAHQVFHIFGNRNNKFWSEFTPAAFDQSVTIIVNPT